MSETTSPTFDWRIYADATFAGLSVLIPIPLLDLLFEWIFRRRMPQAIARQNGRFLDPTLQRELNRTPLSCLALLFWPVMLALEFLKRLYRTLLYFLTIKAATDQLSFYWHRAYLLDYMFRHGHLDEGPTALRAIDALNRILADTPTSPVQQLAQQLIAQIVALPTHIFRTLRRLLRQQVEDETVVQTKSLLAASWQQYDGYWQGLAERYEAALEAEQTAVPH